MFAQPEGRALDFGDLDVDAVAASVPSPIGFLPPLSCSFGTNDLTQMTYGISRDDVSRFLSSYLAKGLMPADPFQVSSSSRGGGGEKRGGAAAAAGEGERRG